MEAIVTMIANISAIYAAFAAGTRSLLKGRRVIESKPAAREGLVAEPPWRNRYRISGAEYPIAPIFPRYQY
jgi:hypothetical protein